MPVHGRRKSKAEREHPENFDPLPKSNRIGPSPSNRHGERGHIHVRGDPNWEDNERVAAIQANKRWYETDSKSPTIDSHPDEGTRNPGLRGNLAKNRYRSKLKRPSRTT